MNAEQLRNKQLACVYATRLLYEGLSLSGYSPKADAAMRVIDCAKSDSEKGWRVAKRINVQHLEYDYAFKLGEELPTNQWREISGPSELVALLGDETNITVDIAKELLKSAAILRTYKKIEGEGLVGISEKSGYFKYVNDAILQGSLRRIGQGQTGDMEPDIYGGQNEPDYDPATAPGKSLPEILVERKTARNMKFSPLANLTHKIACAHQQIRVAQQFRLKQEEENSFM